MLIIPAWVTSPIYLYGEFQRLARYLLCENVEFAEVLYSRQPSDHVDDERKLTVFKYLLPGNEDAEYVVIQNGTRFTTKNLPPGVRNEDVITVDYTSALSNIVPRRLGLRRLKRIGMMIRKASDDMYRAFRIESRVEEIEAWYSQDSNETSHRRSPEAIVQRTFKARQRVATPANLIGDSQEIINAIMGEFGSLRVTGEVAQRAMAVCSYFCLFPEPNRLVEVIEKTFNFRESMARELGGQISFIPPMALGFYLRHPDLIGADSFITAKGAGRMLRTRSKELCKDAMISTTVTQFHINLYGALLSYRGALEVYRILKHVGKTVPEIWRDYPLDENEIHQYWVEAEEGRVSIMAALKTAATTQLGFWNPARPLRCLALSSHILHTRGLERAERKIRDLGVRLVIPEFVCELLLASIHLEAEKSLDRWFKRVVVLSERLESALKYSAQLGDPNYLLCCYLILERFCELSNHGASSQEFARKREGLAFRIQELLSA